MWFYNAWHNHQLAALGLMPLAESIDRDTSNEARVQRLRRAIHAAVRTDAALRGHDGGTRLARVGVPQEVIDARKHLRDLGTTPPQPVGHEPLQREDLTHILSPVSTSGPPDDPDEPIPFVLEAYRDAAAHLFAHEHDAWNAARKAFHQWRVGDPLVRLAERLPRCCLQLDGRIVGAMVDGMLGYPPHGDHLLDDSERVWGWDSILDIPEGDLPSAERDVLITLLRDADRRFLKWLDERELLLLAVQQQLATGGRPAVDVAAYFSSVSAWERGALEVLCQFAPPWGHPFCRVMGPGRGARRDRPE